MTDCTAPHEGIELDLMDLFNGDREKIGSRTFDQSILKRMIGINN